MHAEFVIRKYPITWLTGFNSMQTERSVMQGDILIYLHETVEQIVRHLTVINIISSREYRKLTYSLSKL